MYPVIIAATGKHRGETRRAQGLSTIELHAQIEIIPRMKGYLLREKEEATFRTKGYLPPEKAEVVLRTTGYPLHATTLPVATDA